MGSTHSYFSLLLQLIFTQPNSAHRCRHLPNELKMAMNTKKQLDFSKLSEFPRLSELPRACTVQCLRKVILNLFPSMIFSVCSSHLHQMIFQSIILMIIEIFQTKDHHMNALHAKAVVVNLVQYDVIFLWSIIFPSSNIWSNMWNVFAINYETYCLLCQM